MSELRDDLAEIDRMIHEPARLAILTSLSACKSADFQFLQRLIGLTPGNLSSHLSRLEEAGLVWIEKDFVGKRSHTRVGLTPAGQQSIDRHWRQLEGLRSRAASIGSQKEGDQA